MAVFAPGYHLSIRTLLIYGFVLSSALLLHSWLPNIVQFVTEELPTLYSAVSTCLKPTYLYILIILCIVVSSKFKHSGSGSVQLSPLSTQTAVGAAIPYEVIPKQVDAPFAYAGYESDGYIHGVAEEYVAWKALRVSRPRRHDTLESTWRTITDGRAMPLTRHLKKSDTWATHARGSIDNYEYPQPPPNMNKPETFEEITGPKTEQHEAGKLRKEPSLGREELNRRVESFIRKFNEEMRLQREESLNQFQEMIHRGTS